MKKTLISHFYNEEFLLPHWLNHHKKIFDDAILINYQSTDKSVQIIKEICPDWKIFDSEHDEFDSKLLNEQVENYEKKVDGFKICLNTTEFILGNFNLLENVSDNIQLTIPAFCMVDKPGEEFKELTGDLIQTCRWGFDYKVNFTFKQARSLHNFNLVYPEGRHFAHYSTEEFVILWYGFSPFNEKLLKRKLQIGAKLSKSDISGGAGVQHLWDENKQIEELRKHQQYSRDLSEDIERYLKITFT